MELNAMKCPSCGAPIKFESKQDFIYCSHCGMQVFKEDKNTKTLNINKAVNVNKSLTYTTVDAARLKEIELEEKKFDAQEKHRKIKAISIIIAVVLCVILAIVGVAYSLNKGGAAEDMLIGIVALIGGIVFFIICIFLGVLHDKIRDKFGL